MGAYAKAPTLKVRGGEGRVMRGEGRQNDRCPGAKNPHAATGFSSSTGLYRHPASFLQADYSKLTKIVLQNI